ncbi:uncharacterized protein LOC117303539 isoform X2 [Asterias rubens]|uniref:uncharacterized protein LOC117303539 isoform X2 n=1 Tax=Asterias rubens TaxID=7604 RepID=UPI0014550783|nr:uncharacterized protein LOC117303539 isoform X2 [Asterias rubens]
MKCGQNSKFIDVCRPLLKTNQQNAITKLLKDKFVQARKEYTKSEKFHNLLEQHISDLQSKKKSVYVHIQDVKTLLMKASDNLRKEAVKEANVSDDESQNDAQIVKKEQCRRVEEEGGSADLEMTCETISSGSLIEYLKTDRIPQPEVEEMHDDDAAKEHIDQGAGPSLSVNTPATIALDERNGKTMKSVESDRKEKKKDKGKGSQRQINKLELILKRIGRAIKKLEERELTLDEMDEEDSVHIQEYQLRKRFMKVYNMYCKLNECSPSTGRVIEQKIHYEGTRFPEINKKLERLINKKDFFPDFPDVYKAVYKTNKKKDLGLNRRKINSIAQEAFEDVGRKLQKRRQQDFILNFSAHSTIDFSTARDPSDRDPELKKKLLENKNVALQKLKEVDEPFVKRQEEYEKNGIVLEAAENSESDVASDVPTDDEADEPPSKRQKNDCSDEEEQKMSENENKGNAKETEGTPHQTVNSFITAPSHGELQPNLADPLSQQQHFQVHAQDMGSSNGSVLSRRVSTFHSGVVSDNLDHSNVSDIIKPYKSAIDVTGNGLFTCYDDGAAVKVATTHSIKSPQLLPIKPDLQPSLHYNTAEQAVRALKHAPFLITNVCSLSPDYKHQHKPHKVAWTQGETIAFEDEHEGFVISQPKRQKIIAVQSGVKNVKLQTSAPITLSIDDSETELSSENPEKETNLANLPRETGSCSPTSTQPDLDVHLNPDIHEVTVASTQGQSLKGSTELKKTITNDPPVRKVFISRYPRYKSSTETTQAGQVLVSKTRSTCNSVQCSPGPQIRSGVTRDGCKPICIQSTLVSNSSSYLKKSSPATNLQTQISPLKPFKPTALFQDASGNKAQIKRPITPQKRTIPLKIKCSPKWQRNSAQSTGSLTCPRPASNNKEDSKTIIIISDSDSEIEDMTDLQPESTDVICITDSD